MSELVFHCFFRAVGYVLEGVWQVGLILVAEEMWFSCAIGGSVSHLIFVLPHGNLLKSFPNWLYHSIILIMLVSWAVLIVAGLLLSILIVCGCLILSDIISTMKAKLVCRVVLICDAHHN